MDEVNYEKAYQHWSSVTSNVEGMLGGYERLHLPDVNYSKKLLDELTKKVLILIKISLKLILETFDQF